MVWPFTSNTSGDSDAIASLDPELRKFLDKESPLKYPTKPTKPESPTTTPHPYSAASIPPAVPPVQSTSNSSTQTSTDNSSQTPSDDTSSSTTVPSESLYQDGRYAHLWATYKSKSETESASRSPAEKLSDVLGAYKDRKASIGAAALENCALQQWAQNECTNHGSWKQRMTMCRDETRALDRCYTMNTRFLKALGYLSVYGRTEAEEENIQMHADRLFQRMTEQEREVEKAKQEGREIPQFKGLMEDGADYKVDGLQNLKPSKKEEFKKRLEGLGPMEREIEERAIVQEVRAGRDVQKYMVALKGSKEKTEAVDSQTGNGSEIGDGPKTEATQDTEKKFWGIFGR